MRHSAGGFHPSASVPGAAPTLVSQLRRGAHRYNLPPAGDSDCPSGGRSYEYSRPMWFRRLARSLRSSDKRTVPT